MRVESSVLTVSWIPSEAVPGVVKLTFEAGFTHYDEPPPDVIADIGQLVGTDRYRFANHLRAYVEFDGAGQVVSCGHLGRGYIGNTTVRFGGPKGLTLPGVANPDIRVDPEMGDGWVRFVQTTGGRTGLPAPRHINRPPFVKIEAPPVWTTLALTIRADGSAEHHVLGASNFPRHWVYDATGALVGKSGTADFKEWYRSATATHSPWGDEEDHPALVTEAESAIERELSTRIMRGGEAPEIRTIKEGACLVQQGSTGDELYLLLDGVLNVEVDGETVAEVGPGAILGERAALEGGTRTSTLRAVTPVRVAVARADQLDPRALVEVSAGHRREDA